MRKRKKQSKTIRLPLWLAALLLIAAWALSHTPVADWWRQQVQQPAATLALPEGTQLELPAPLSDRPAQTIAHRGYTLSYNRDTKQANWVAWELNRDKLVERESRTDKFLPDPNLPADEAVTTDDYVGSGYDRGHLCPAGDNRYHWRAMQESFYMTNICPQNHNLNAGDWKELEELCRRWAEQEGTIYIVCGPVFQGKRHKTIGRQHRIPVPESFFKAVLCTSCQPPRAIGFLFANRAGNRPLEKYVTTVDQLEELTGIDFFASLPDDVEQVVESAADLSQWSR